MCSCLLCSHCQGPYEAHFAVANVSASYNVEVRFVSGRVHDQRTLPVLDSVMPSALVRASGQTPLLFVRDVPAITLART